ncbi:MAG: HAD family phosphatase [Clostridia bacterium]|nr:HAD family phosphatase [Clostridia bacterium]
MIKNVIFDIGNVILKYSREFLVDCIYQGDEYELLKEKLFTNWEKLDEDLLTLQEYEQQVLNSLPNHLHSYASAVLNNWEYFMTYTEGMRELIADLKQHGYNLYILSNITRHFINCEYKFPILDLFDGIVYSAPIKMVKPNPEIYEHLLNKYSLKAEECLFIDDTKTNLTAAARFGIHTFYFNDNVNELRDYIFNSLSL